MTILFEDAVLPEAAMPFWNLQFNMNYKLLSFLSVYMVAVCTIVLFIPLSHANFFNLTLI